MFGAPAVLTCPTLLAAEPVRAALHGTARHVTEVLVGARSQEADTQRPEHGNGVCAHDFSAEKCPGHVTGKVLCDALSERRYEVQPCGTCAVRQDRQSAEADRRCSR